MRYRACCTTPFRRFIALLAAQRFVSGKKVEEECVEYVFKHATPGDAESVMNKIDEFCHSQWMMNVGDEKGVIVDNGTVPTVPEDRVARKGRADSVCVLHTCTVSGNVVCRTALPVVCRTPPCRDRGSEKGANAGH